MANGTYRDKERQTASGKGSPSGKRGKLLYEVETDRKRIGLEILARTALSTVGIVASFSRGINAFSIAAAVVFAVFCAWPLLHMGDRMEFYENGILYLGQWYPIGRQTRVDWVGGQSFVLPTTWLGVSCAASGCGAATPGRTNTSPSTSSRRRRPRRTRRSSRALPGRSTASDRLAGHGWSGEYMGGPGGLPGLPFFRGRGRWMGRKFPTAGAFHS